MSNSLHYVCDEQIAELAGLIEWVLDFVQWGYQDKPNIDIYEDWRKFLHENRKQDPVYNCYDSLESDLRDLAGAIGRAKIDRQAIVEKMSRNFQDRMDEEAHERDMAVEADHTERGQYFDIAKDLVRTQTGDI